MKPGVKAPIYGYAVYQALRLIFVARPRMSNV